MKHSLMAAAVLALTLGSAVAANANQACNVLLNPSAAIAWRASLTQTSNVNVATSTEREDFIKRAKQAMEKFLFDEEDTPEMIFVQAEGITVSVPQRAVVNSSKNTIPLNYTKNPAEQGYHYETVPQIQVSGLGPSGVLKGTMLLPVSGHTGIPNATKWSKTDTFSIYLENRSGQRIATLANNVLSLDYVTAQDIEAKLTPNEVYKITYYRSGSGGPSGYPDGRIYEIVWDGK